MFLRIGSALLLASSFGCSTGGTMGPSRFPIDNDATTIYRGAVFAPDGSQPFRYARSSSDEGETRRSTHVTHDARSNALAVVQHAEHSTDYEVHAFHESYPRRNIDSTGLLLQDGGLRIDTRNGHRRRTRVEHHDEPFIVGPTLFGFVLAHWDELVRGETIDVRFVVADRGRSYGFRLHMESSELEHTTISMTADSVWLRCSVPTIRMIFESRSRRIVRYEGRVPPRANGRTLDARVEYEHVAPRYR